MSRFLRWQGLVGFSLIIGFIISFIYLFAESLVKKGIEAGGSYYLGAEVNVASVEINYYPLEIILNDFQATDSEEPQLNLVSFESSSASIEFWQYLFGKIIINELSIENLAFATKRMKPGKVFQSDEKEEKDGDAESLFSTPDISLPDPQSLLDNANLLTIQASKDLQKSYHEEHEKLKALQDKLPNKAKLKNYEEKIKALSKIKVKSLADLEQIKSEFEQIKQQFKKDKLIVEQAKLQLTQSKQILTERTTALKNAPNEDWQQIYKEYQLDKVDGADFTHLLFGSKARAYYQYAQDIFQRLKPILSGNSDHQKDQKSSAEGRFIHFDEEDPLPDFLIKKANISINFARGDFSAEFQELTLTHWLRNKPTTFDIYSNKLAGNGDAKFSGKFYVSQSNELNGVGAWGFHQLGISDVEMQKGSNFSMVLDEAFLAGDGKFSLSKGHITTLSKVNLSETKFTVGGESSTSRIIHETFSTINELEVTLEAMGPISSPTWKISSPLDNLLQQVVQAQLLKKMGGFQKDVQSGLNTKLSDELELNSVVEADILNFDALVNDTDQALEDLMNSDVVKQHKKQLKDKVEDKLKKKLGDLFG